MKAKWGEVFTRNCLCMSVLRGVGEAVKAKNEKRRTSARNTRTRGGTLHPRGGRPTRRTKKARANDEKTGGRRWKTRNFSIAEARREQRRRGTANHRVPMQKKVGGRRRNCGGFRNFAPQTGHAPERRRFLAPPLRPTAPMRRENTPSPVTLKRP